MNKQLVVIASVGCMLLVTPAKALPEYASGSIPVKDPYIAEREAEWVLFGGTNARKYLETGYLGETIELPAEVARYEQGSTIGSYVMLMGWTITLAYALFVPNATSNFWDGNTPSILRGLVAGSAGLTYAQWYTQRTNVAPYFRHLAIDLNTRTAPASTDSTSVRPQ